MKPNGNSLLLQLLRNPSEMVSLSLQQWDIIIPLARQTRVLGVFAHQAIEQGLVGNIPEPVRPHLVAENRLTLRQEQMVRWEVDRITDALSDVETPIVFLKGAAYCLLDLPSAKGRLFSDTDLLIHKSALDDAETALKNNGWREKEKIDQLNSRYFRQWLHELPPLQHKERMTEIDVHHTILPLTDKLNVDPAELIASSKPIKKTTNNRIRVLSPADMVLHSATHLFRAGDYTVGLRDLFDLHGMVIYFSAFEVSFWSDLRSRAITLDLKRPCFYAMHYIRKYFHTDITADFLETLRTWAPSPPCLKVLDLLIERAVLPRQLAALDPVREISSLLLSYWPLPRLKTWLTPLFWKKRFPRN
jgi:hypothetical protein